MKAIIVDDELAARNILESLIRLTNPNIEIIASETNLPDAVLAIKELKPDLVFLDIEMPKYAGYEIAKFIDNIDFHIIFVTAYDKYAINAFKLNAIDYILKPIERTRLGNAIKKVEIRIEEGLAKKNYHNLLLEIENKNSKTIKIAEQNKTHIIPIGSIIAINAHGAYSSLFCKDKPPVIFSKNIGYFEKLLKAENYFFRCHKSWVINMRSILNYSKSDATILLEANIEAKLSRNKKKVFNELLEKEAVII